MKPITPQEAKLSKEINVPNFVIKAFNKCIIANINESGKSVVIQKDVINQIIKSSPSKVTKIQVIVNGWLDVEPIYRKVGWEVSYDKPGYNEDYEPFFEFSRGKF
jgi:hypothetical protein